MKKKALYNISMDKMRISGPLVSIIHENFTILGKKAMFRKKK